MLELRAQGKSQQDVAGELGVDRVWISRLETLGEVRKGGSLAIVGFPIGNANELNRLAAEEDVEFCLLLNDKERWAWASNVSGADIFNRIMDLISQIKEYDTLIFLGSDMRIRLIEAILGRDMVIGIELGVSPIRGDISVDHDMLRQIIHEVKKGGRRKV